MRRWSSVAITHQSVAECVLQGSEPGLVVLPLIQPLAIDGLPHLLRARRAYAALGLMKLHAARLEVQAAKVENPPHIAFEVIDHLLVLDSENPSGQPAVPVPHQLEIRAVVARDVLDAVRELLSGGEQLLQIAETAGHGLAAGVDDLGVRQYQVNETYMPEVVRHLVDEVRPVRPVNAGIAEVFFAQS